MASSLGELWRAARSVAAAEAEDEVQRRLLLDVVVGEGAAVLELLAREDEALLVRRDALLVLDLLLHVVDGVRGLHVERDRLAYENSIVNQGLGNHFFPAAQRRQSPRRPAAPESATTDVASRARASPSASPRAPAP